MGGDVRFWESIVGGTQSWLLEKKHIITVFGINVVLNKSLHYVSPRYAYSETKFIPQEEFCNKMSALGSIGKGNSTLLEMSVYV